LKILLTGFNSFQGVRSNPSEQVVKEIARRVQSGVFAPPRATIVTTVLPTEYAAATRQLRRRIRTVRPDAVLCLGVAPRRKKISLERVALNLDDEPTRDNAGAARRGSKIAARGLDLYWATLPLDTMLAALKKRRIPAYISNHAGTFLCNHVFYIARRETARRTIPCGFVHVPGVRGKRRAATLRRLVNAIEICLGVLSTKDRERIAPGARR
jgi:pyroglutamyl-peptidase